jgi:hypothetical protein
LVSVFDSYIVVAPSYVDFGEVFGAFKFVEEVGNSGEGVSVSDGGFVKLSIVLTETERSVFLGDEEERCGLRGERGTDVSFFEVLFEELVELEIFSRGKAVDLASCGDEIALEVDLVVPGT